MHLCKLPATFILCMNLLPYWWTQQFCYSEYCLGFGRWVIVVVLVNVPLKFEVVSSHSNSYCDCRNQETFWFWLGLMQRMKYYTPCHSWLVLCYGHRCVHNIFFITWKINVFWFCNGQRKPHSQSLVCLQIW